MEGRTAVRPNGSPSLGAPTWVFAACCERLWEATASEGSVFLVKVRFALCHKAASGPWDLRPQPSARIR